MANSKTLNDALNSRSPSAQKEAAKAIQPIDPLEITPPIHNDDKPVRQQTLPQSVTYKQISFDARTDFIKAVKQIALDTDRNEKEIYNEALEEYLQRH